MIVTGASKKNVKTEEVKREPVKKTTTANKDSKEDIKTTTKSTTTKPKKTTKSSTTKKTTTTKKSSTSKTTKTVSKTTTSNTKATADTNKKATSDKKTNENANIVYGGDKNCYGYFSIKFTNHYANADIMSLALVTSEGKSFYAEFNDYDNASLAMTSIDIVKAMVRPKDVLEGDHITMIGNRGDVRHQLIQFIEREYRDKKHTLQLVGDKIHYEFMKMLDVILGGNTIGSLPDWIVEYSVDLNDSIATSLTVSFNEDKSKYDNYIPNQSAAGINRIVLLHQFTGELKKDLNINNSLDEAKLIKELHQIIWGFNKD